MVQSHPGVSPRLTDLACVCRGGVEHRRGWRDEAPREGHLHCRYVAFSAASQPTTVASPCLRPSAPQPASIRAPSAGQGARRLNCHHGRGCGWSVAQGRTRTRASGSMMRWKARASSPLLRGRCTRVPTTTAHTRSVSPSLYVCVFTYILPRLSSSACLRIDAVLTYLESYRAATQIRNRLLRDVCGSSPLTGVWKDNQFMGEGNYQWNDGSSYKGGWCAKRAAALRLPTSHAIDVALHLVPLPAGRSPIAV